MIKAIIFDFDGVIGNTYGINFELFKDYHENFTEQDFKNHFNKNAFEKSKTQIKDKDNDVFFQNQKEKFTKNHLFPLENMLEKLSKEFLLFIITSTIDENINHFLKLNNFNRFFKQILGSTTHRSKVEKFKTVIEKYNLKSNECLFITDTIGDIIEARNADVKSIAVSWGYHDKETLLKEKPLAIDHNENELLEIIEKYK